MLPCISSVLLLFFVLPRGNIANGLSSQQTSITTSTRRLHSYQPLSAFQLSPFLRFGNRETSKLSHEAAVVAADKSKSASTGSSRSCLSLNLIRAILFNQGAVLLLATALTTLILFVFDDAEGLLSLHWNEGTDCDYHSLFDWNITPLQVLEGTVVAIPMVMIGCLIENSDRRDACQVNFSTVNMVISLFGRRHSPRDPEATKTSTVMAIAALIALSTGISEEIVFRGYIPTGIQTASDSVALAAVGQAMLFALAHVSPRAPLGENRIVGGLQLLNGLWYGFIYSASGGDIVPCIVAHTLYDMHVLCETWSMINKQMDYTNDAFQEQLQDSELEQLARIQQLAGPSLDNDTLNLARRFFYAFDDEQKGSLSLSNVHRAVNYAFLKNDLLPENAEVEEVFDRVIDSRDATGDCPGNRLTVSEFLRLLLTLRSKGAMRV